MRHQFLRPPDEVGLQYGFALEALRLHPRLAFGAGFPGILRHFVATDVKITSGKDRRDLAQHLVKEFERGVVAGAEYVLGDG